MNSMTYITRRCVRNCSYCNASKVASNELTPEQWIEAFHILKEIGVEFNLILGNESWILGDDLITIMEKNEVPYGLYTTAPPSLFSPSQAVSYFESGIDNISCGVDFLPFSMIKKDIPISVQNTDEYKKSMDGIDALLWTRKHCPHIDTHATITIHNKNVHLLSDMIRFLSDEGIFIATNFIHWNKDGKYDFFPSYEVLKKQGYILSVSVELEHQMNTILNMNEHRVQNPEYLETWKKAMYMNWHCQGNPYGGPTIESDGSLRCCAYRKGEYSSQFNIFDLKDEWKRGLWKEAMYEDAIACPGCAWSYAWGYHYWQDRDPKFREKAFTNHAIKGLSEDKWSRRVID